MIELNPVLTVLRNWHYESHMPEQFLVMCILLDVVDKVYARDIQINLRHFIRLALKSGFPKCLRWLLAHPRLKYESFDLLLEPGQSLMILEIMNSGNLEFMRVVVQCARAHFGHDLRAKFSYCSLIAASKGLIDLWNLFYQMGISLVDNRSAVSAPGESDFTCLAAAILGHKWALVSIMLNQIAATSYVSGPKLDDRTWLLVLNAGRSEIFERMLDLGLKPSSRLMEFDGDCGVTWLMLAASGWGDQSSITYLILRNPEEVHWRNKNGRSVAHYIASSPPILPSGFGVLIGHIDFGIVDVEGQCPLTKLIRAFNVPLTDMRSVVEYSSRCVPSLLEALNSPDHRRLELIKIFMRDKRYNIFEDHDDQGRSFLWHVCRLGRADVLEFMLDQMRDKSDFHTLHYAELMQVAASEPIMRLLRRIRASTM